jgi:hypothetical protein
VLEDVPALRVVQVAVDAHQAGQRAERRAGDARVEDFDDRAQVCVVGGTPPRSVDAAESRDDGQGFHLRGSGRGGRH